jgi:phage-related protein
VVYPKIVAVLTAISKLLRGDFAGAWQTVKNVVVTAWTEVYNVVSRVITDLYNRVRSFIGDILGTAINFGKDIVNGIATGIMQAKASVERALRSVIDAAIQKIKDMLGISSPSKAMASMIGVPMVQGIISGSATGVQRAVQAPPAEASQTVQNFYLTANYQTTQSQSSVRNDLRAMQLLAGGVA